LVDWGLVGPEDYSAKDYAKFRYLLFSDETPREELEEICMTLAHLPTEVKMVYWFIR